MSIANGTGQQYYNTRQGNNSGVMWSEGGMQHSALVTDPDVAAWLEGNTPAAAAVPPKPTVISRAAFLARFEQSELIAIATAAQTDAAIHVWLIIAQAQDAIDLTAAETKAGLDALVTATLFTADRETAILTP